jgi:hypothetical protein
MQVRIHQIRLKKDIILDEVRTFEEQIIPEVLGRLQGPVDRMSRPILTGAFLIPQGVVSRTDQPVDPYLLVVRPREGVGMGDFDETDERIEQEALSALGRFAEATSSLTYREVTFREPAA